LALWEHLIEPVEQLKDGKLVHCPWELRADVSFVKYTAYQVNYKLILCNCLPVIKIISFICNSLPRAAVLMQCHKHPYCYSLNLRWCMGLLVTQFNLPTNLFQSHLGTNK
jgi:hypothetical protein